jgi:putative restriction endonuclease
MYDTSEPASRELWRRVMQARVDSLMNGSDSMIAEGGGKYGREYLARARLGQGAFRVLVTEAYHRACAVTGERTLPVLEEAAHIKPFTDSGPNRTDNGPLLRSDWHILFDRGYVTITLDYRVEISRRIKDEFDNGREYYPLHGRKLNVLPDTAAERPGRELIEWHNTRVFVAWFLFRRLAWTSEHHFASFRESSELDIYCRCWE